MESFREWKDWTKVEKWRKNFFLFLLDFKKAPGQFYNLKEKKFVKVNCNVLVGVVMILTQVITLFKN